jgi:hypothetical protein
MPSVMGKQWVSNATWQKRMKNEANNKEEGITFAVFRKEL